MALALPTPEEVKAIIPTDLSDAEVQSFIDDAALLVKRCVSRLDAETQKVIIKYTAAHLIQSAGKSTGEGFGNVAVTSMKLGDASETYSRAQAGSNLAGTWYGQQAILYDPNGCLTTLGQRPVIFKVV